MLKNRMLNGLLLIDKPSGETSARIVAQIKKRLNVPKAGHCGTLDPFATGLLLICVNEATKLANFFLKSSKLYEGTIRLGIETDTQDVTGSVISEKDPSHVTQKVIADIIATFSGEIEQHPPTYSALKQNGRPLYKLAREGKPINKPPRKIFIYAFEIVDISMPIICFRVQCSSGTYVRSLAAEIGRRLGCGAYLETLRRLQSGHFKIQNAVSPQSDDLADHLIGCADALSDIPEIAADEKLVEKIKFGRPITENDIKKENIGLSNPARHYTNPSHIKIINAMGQLLAILHMAGDNDVYRYDCVFNTPC